MKNMTSLLSLRRVRQRGYALVATIIAVVILAGIVAFYISGSSSGNGMTEKLAARARAGTIVQQAGDITSSALIGFSRYRTGAWSDYVNQASLLGQNLEPPADAFSKKTVNDGFWIYRPVRLIANNVGTSGVQDAALLLTGLSKAVCERLNVMMQGTTDIPVVAFPISSFRSTNVTKAANTSGVNAPVEPTISLPVTVNGWHAGCVETSDNNAYYVYFHILKPN